MLGSTSPRAAGKKGGVVPGVPIPSQADWCGADFDPGRLPGCLTRFVAQQRGPVRQIPPPPNADYLQQKKKHHVFWPVELGLKYHFLILSLWWGCEGVVEKSNKINTVVMIEVGHIV